MDELQSADLGDKRLAGRLIQLIDSFSKASTASIPAACHDHAEMTAAYRFFDNNKVQFENPHRCQLPASRQKNVVLLVQDTIELELT